MFENQNEAAQKRNAIAVTADLGASVLVLAVKKHYKKQGRGIPLAVGIPVVGLSVAARMFARHAERTAAYWEGAENGYAVGEFFGHIEATPEPEATPAPEAAVKTDAEVEADGAALAAEHDDTDDDGVPVDSGNVFDYLNNLAEELGMHTPTVDGNLAVKEEYNPLADLPTFAEDLHAGRATVYDMDKYVDVWNRLNAKGVNTGTIPEFLGLSLDEYRGIIKQLNRDTDN